MTLGTAGTLDVMPENKSFHEANDDSSDEYDDEDASQAFLKKGRKRTSRAINGGAVKEEIIYDYDIKNYAVEKPMREVRFNMPLSNTQIILNPLTTLIGMIPLWGTTIWCMLQPDAALENLVEIRGNIAHDFTWFIVITKPLSFFFICWIAWKYGHIRFGGQDAKPEFGNLEYFTMLFASGVGVGIYYYGVSEPLWHQSSHWFSEAGYRSQDEIDQMALLITLYHWGVHGWSSYIVVAIATSLASYRFRLPMVFRSTFYPILFEYTWGWMGDVLDGVGIVVTIAGICTSLGLGAIQITAGVQKLGWLDEDLSESETVRAQIVVIWVITIITTASVLSGLNVGIKYLSMAAFATGALLTLGVLMMDQTAYLMNLAVQTMGQYIQYAFLQLSFHTDAFGQLNSGEGRAVDGNAAATWWFDAWTIFYWNWWVAWAVFVGLFIARISYGRTLREVVVYTLLFPLLYLLLWFSIWGGTGIRQARQALELEQLGTTYFNQSDYFGSTENDNCYDVPQQDVVLGVETIFESHITGVTPVCKFYSTNEAAFNVLYSFSFGDDWETGYGPYLSILFLVGLTLSFATSSDSGSLVVDLLSANGRHGTHWMQRVFWALTEASVATALLLAGGSNALAAVQAASIICGLPYTVVLLFLLQSIYEMCEQALDEDQLLYKAPKRQFIMPVYGGIFNVFEFIASLGQVHTSRRVLGLDLPSSFQTTEFFTALVLPFLPLQDVVFSLYPNPDQKKTNMLLLVVYTLLFFFWVTCIVISISLKPSMMYWGLAAYVVSACLLANVKHTLRLRRRLHGNVTGDLMSSFLLYPQVITQIRIELIENGADQVKKDKPKKKKNNSMDARSTHSRGSRRKSTSSEASVNSEHQKSVRSKKSTASRGKSRSSRDHGDEETAVSRPNRQKQESTDRNLDSSERKHRASPVPPDQERSRSPKRMSAADVRGGLRARLAEKQQKPPRESKAPVEV